MTSRKTCAAEWRVPSAAMVMSPKVSSPIAKLSAIATDTNHGPAENTIFAPRTTRHTDYGPRIPRKPRIGCPVRGVSVLSVFSVAYPRVVRGRGCGIVAAMVSIRRAVASDAPQLGTLGAMLMRTHYAFDPQRFLAAGAQAARGYANFLESQLDDDESVVFVAEQDTRIIGYVYAGLEPMSWKELRGPAAFIHDVMIEEEAAGQWRRDCLDRCGDRVGARAWSGACDVVDGGTKHEGTAALRAHRVSANDD